VSVECKVAKSLPGRILLPIKVPSSSQELPRNRIPVRINRYIFREKNDLKDFFEL